MGQWLIHLNNLIENKLEIPERKEEARVRVNFIHRVWENKLHLIIIITTDLLTGSQRKSATMGQAAVKKLIIIAKRRQIEICLGCFDCFGAGDPESSQ